MSNAHTLSTGGISFYCHPFLGGTQVAAFFIFFSLPTAASCGEGSCLVYSEKEPRDPQVPQVEKQIVNFLLINPHMEELNRAQLLLRFGVGNADCDEMDAESY